MQIKLKQIAKIFKIDKGIENIILNYYNLFKNSNNDKGVDDMVFL